MENTTANKKHTVRLRERLLLVYLVGGLLPMLCMVLFLIGQQRSAVVSLSRNTAYSELTTLKYMLAEDSRILEDVSKRMYFDEELERIARTQYADYAQVVADCRAYTTLNAYEDYYSGHISSISVYLENDTFTGNSQLAQATDEVKQSAWYQQALADQGRARWWYLENPTDGREYLTLVRLIRTKSGEMVGVAALRMNLESLETQFAEYQSDLYILLGEKIVLSNQHTPETDGQQLSVLAQRHAGVEKAVQDTLNGRNIQLVVQSVTDTVCCNTLTLLSVEPYANLLESVNDSMRGSLWFVAGSICLSLVLIVVLSNHFARRVERFKGEMEKASRGERELAPAIGGNDEISELYAYLNSMIADIDNLTSRVYESRLEQEQLRTRQREAEFKMLASQINPHFLYNTLESIRMKAYAAGDTEAAEMIKMLSKLMRRNTEIRDTLVSLKSELTLTEYYLKIQHARFGDAIRYKFWVDEGAEELTILPLLLQPIVENAFVHGLKDRRAGGQITVRVELADQLRITIADNGCGIPAQKLAEIRQQLSAYDPASQTHIGVANVNQRIKLYYGPEYGITVESEDGRGTQVTLHLPRRTEGEGRTIYEQHGPEA